MTEGGVEDVGENPRQFRSAVVESGGADVIRAGVLLLLKSPEGPPHLLLVDGERGGGSGGDGGGAGACSNLPLKKLSESGS